MDKELVCISCRRKIGFRETYYINTDAELYFCERCMAGKQIDSMLSWDIALTDGYTDEEIRSFEAFKQDAGYGLEIEVELDPELIAQFN